MLRNYLLVAFRHLKKQKGFASINAAGLGVGLACCLFILLYVRDELSYDRQPVDANRIFRVTAAYQGNGRHWAPIGPPVGPAMAAQFSEIESVARFFPTESPIVFRVGDRFVEEGNGGHADSTFISFFSIQLLEGLPKTALAEPATMVISERLASRLFGNRQALGQTVEVVGAGDVVVSGIMADPPSTTHLPIDYLVSMSTFSRGNEEWLADAKTWAGFLTYVKLRSPELRGQLESELPGFADRFMEGRFEQKGSDVVHYVLQPLTDIHLHSNLEKEYRANGDVAYVYTFSIVAFFVLLIACVNFINLTTARAAGRMQEVAVRKSFGASRRQLIRQHLMESILLATAGLALALVLIVLLLPSFNNLTAKTLDLASVLDLRTVAVLVGLTVAVGLISGLYPAFVLSAFRPATALRGLSDRGHGRSSLRRGLVVFQFSISIFLIAGSAIIWQQLDFVRSRQLGFDKEHVLDVDLGNDIVQAVTDNPKTVKDELARIPGVVSVSNASDRPGLRYSMESMTVDGRADDQGTMMRVAWRSDYDYASALGLQIVDGRDFSESAPTDTSAWLINESAARRLELEDPVGQILRWGDYAGPIVGVVRDFNFRSLHAEIEPLVIPLRPGHGGHLLVRFAPGNPEKVRQQVSATLQRLYPGSYFSYSYVGDTFDALYASDDTLRAILGYFSGIAIFIACLGLFGLAAFTSQQRTKEIGVRKVLGASVRSIVGLLSREFLILVTVAFVVAAPVTWLAASDWLSGFAYRIDIQPLVFVGAGIAAFLIALATVGFQASRAALANPIASLRYE